MRSGRVKYRSMRRSGETLRDYGCIAIITGTANFDVTVEGKDLSVELKFTSTWAKRERSHPVHRLAGDAGSAQTVAPTPDPVTGGAFGRLTVFSVPVPVAAGSTLLAARAATTANDEENGQNADTA